MTITKYTFFSPEGNNFPVTANADAKLHMMLGDLPYNTFIRKDFQATTQAGLTKTYVNTSLVVAGRYFELRNHLINLTPSTKNYIHVAIDLSTPLDPVSIVVATANQSNEIDINNESGVYKRCIEIIETNGGSISKTTVIPSFKIIEDLKTTTATIAEANVTNLDVSNNVTIDNQLTVSKASSFQNVDIKGLTTTKDLIATGNMKSSADIGGKSLTAQTSTTTKTINIKGDLAMRSNTFRSPTVYSSINGSALPEFLLYRNANTVTGNFADIKVIGGIPGGGAIIGWVQDNAFKPEFTHKFTMYTIQGKRVLLSVDPGGAFRNWGDAVAAGDEIYGGVFWTCKGTEGGIKG